MRAIPCVSLQSVKVVWSETAILSKTRAHTHTLGWGVSSHNTQWLTEVDWLLICSILQPGQDLDWFHVFCFVRRLWKGNKYTEEALWLCQNAAFTELKRKKGSEKKDEALQNNLYKKSTEYRDTMWWQMNWPERGKSVGLKQVWKCSSLHNSYYCTDQSHLEDRFAFYIWSTLRNLLWLLLMSTSVI